MTDSSSPAEVAYFFDLWRTLHAGNFATTYAAYESAADPDKRGLFLEVGAGVEDAMRHRGSKRLRTLIGWLLRRRTTANAGAVAVLVDSIDTLAARRELTARTGFLPDHLRLARAFGAFVCLAAACRRSGSYADNDALASMTARVCRPEGTSATDVKRVVGEFTRVIPLAAWIDAASPAGK